MHPRQEPQHEAHFFLISLGMTKLYIKLGVPKHFTYTILRINSAFKQKPMTVTNITSARNEIKCLTDDYRIS